MKFQNPFRKRTRIGKVGNKEVHMNHVYTDKSGNKWYQPTDMTDLPTSRILDIFEYSKYANFKLTNETLIKIADGILKACNDGEYNDAVLLANEIKVVEALFCEKITLLNLAASMCLINDEPINNSNNIYQAQKIEAMKNDTDCMAFFLPKAYQMLNKYKENSGLQVIEYLQKTMTVMERHQYTLQTILQKQQTTTT